MSPAAESVVVYGKPECVDFRRSSALLGALGVGFEFHDILSDPEAARRAVEISGTTSSPVIVFADGSFQVEPSDDALAQKLGLAVPAGEGEPEASCDLPS
jgi:glutaredoxin